MQVICPNCAARYAVDPSAIGPTGRTVQCVRCSHRWFEKSPPVAPATPARERPVPDFVIRPQPHYNSGLPAISPPRRQVHWGRWITAFVAAALVLGVTAFAYRDEISNRLPPEWRHPEPRRRPRLVRLPAKAMRSAMPDQPRLEIDLAASRVELVDGRYVVAANSSIQVTRRGRRPRSSWSSARATRCWANAPIPWPRADRAGGRLGFSRTLDDPPDGTTNVVPAVECELSVPNRPSVSIRFSATEIAARVDEMAKELASKLPADTLVVSVLKGSFVFAADLIRALSRAAPTLVDGFPHFVELRHRHGATDRVRVVRDIVDDVRQREVLLVDDILGSGLTLSFARTCCRSAARARLGLYPARQARQAAHQFEADFVGFHAGDEFLVGYGLDWAHRFRGLPYIGVVEKNLIRLEQPIDASRARPSAAAARRRRRSSSRISRLRWRSSSSGTLSTPVSTASP
jgi:hypoxanthine phosphoribosyltransferase